MRILFEEYPYDADDQDVKETLEDLSRLQGPDGKVKLGYVGYYFSAKLKDAVFILPKVLLNEQVKGEDGRLAGYIRHGGKGEGKGGGTDVCPQDIVTPKGQEAHLSPEYREFLRGFALWIYRALNVFRKGNPRSDILYQRSLPLSGAGGRRRAETLLDVVLALLKFNRENQDFFFFVTRNLHSGNNRINWSRTIHKGQAVIQKGKEGTAWETPVYLNLVNKRRQVNFDEELLVIFFSILKWLKDEYGFDAPICLNYPLLTRGQFGQYLKGLGKRRLKEIRYKYFSDKALELWDLCYAFFDLSHLLAVKADLCEYLLAKDFQVVFEAMVDELIGDPKFDDAETRFKNQPDGKRVDHIYSDRSLVGQAEEAVYYIADSKYYGAGRGLSQESYFKQYTYAKNVIQLNLDILSENEHPALEERVRRDDVTQGYDVIPNFFISARVDEERNYSKDGLRQRKDGTGREFSSQYPNRLFDRDTLLLSRYDVNFLYVLSLYARNSRGRKAAWREKVKVEFRKEIRRILDERYWFFRLVPRSLKNPEKFIKSHFWMLQGKVYSWNEVQGGQAAGAHREYVLAWDRKDDGGEKLEECIGLLKRGFHVVEYKLAESPQKPFRDCLPDYLKGVGNAGRGKGGDSGDRGGGTFVYKPGKGGGEGGLEAVAMAGKFPVDD